MKAAIMARMHPVIDRVRTGGRLMLSSVCLLLAVQKRRDMDLSAGEIAGDLIAMLRLLGRVGGRGVSFRHLSRFVSSQSNVWPDATWDARLTEPWWVSRRNPKKDCSWPEKMLLFWLEAWARYGFLENAWEMASSLQANAAGAFAELLWVVRLDIACLINSWADELRPYYDGNIWFDPDTVPGFSDALSGLFRQCNEKRLEKMFSDCFAEHPGLAEAWELRGEWGERRLDIASALKAYQLAYAINPAEVIRVKLHRLMQLQGEQDIPEGQGELVSLIEYQASDATKDILNYAYDLHVAGITHRRSVCLEYDEPKLLELDDAIPLHGGLTVAGSQEEGRLYLGSKHLGLRHLKCFAPCVIVHDDKACLLETIHEAGVRREGFIVPGMGWNYYHWLLEVVPLLRHYIDRWSDGEDAPPLVFTFPLRSWNLETLRLLGLQDAPIRPFESGLWYRYQKAWLPQFGSRMLVPSPQDIAFVRGRLAQPRKPRPGKKVYLSRSGVGSVRDMANRKRLEEHYESRGFTVMNTARMGVKKQIEFFSDVEEVAAEGGAALANMVFCPEKTKFHIHSGDRAWAETFSAIAGALGQEVTAHLGRTHPIPGPYYLWTAFDVLTGGKK